MKLFVLGNVAKDSFYYLKKFPNSGETILSENTLKDIGGKGFNQAIAAKRFGADVSFWTYTGSDETKKILFDILELEEISSSNISIQENYSDESIIFINDEGENYIVSDTKNSLNIDNIYVKNMLDRISTNDSILLQGNLKEEVTFYCVKEAFRKKINIFLNPSPICFDYKKIFPYVETIIINEVENMKLSGSNNIEIGNKILLELGISNVITTRGEKGLLYSSKNDYFFLKPSKKVVRDTTGAGDVFCGTLAASISLGNSYRDSCLNAMDIASLSVRKYGTYKSIPSKQEIFLFLKTKKGGNMN